MWGIDDDIYEDYYSGALSSSRKLWKFSSKELKHIGIAMAALIFAFSLPDSLCFGDFNLYSYLVTLVIMTISVSTGFLLHELGHKFTAQMYGCAAEFRYSKLGLALLILSGLTGFLIFAAPGAVMIFGSIDTEKNGKISLAGPGTNAVLAALFGFVSIPLGIMFGVNSLIYLIPYYVAYVNLMLGAFNMIPLYPLDGSKIFKWSVPVYIITVIIFAILYFGLIAGNLVAWVLGS